MNTASTLMRRLVVLACSATKRPDAGHIPDIATALATEGGHLSIGRGGFTLHYRDGAMLSGHDCGAIKAQCIAAGLPVIDSRCVCRSMSSCN